MESHFTSLVLTHGYRHATNKQTPSLWIDHLTSYRNKSPPSKLEDPFKPDTILLCTWVIDYINGMMISALCKTNNWLFMVLVYSKNQSVDIHVSLLKHIIPTKKQQVFYFNPQSCMLSENTTHTYFSGILDMTRSKIEPMIVHTQGEHIYCTTIVIV